ncbi:MAG TPA: hypothetical protein VFR47_33085 [Anaerolineales bacterium]|nr:hypothetical protein [Anaerolineales bacterium]
MNLRCAFCQTPFSIGRNEKLAALQHMYAENLTHYDAHCPRCRRATPVLRQKLEMTLPNWREELKELEAELAAHPQQAAELTNAESAPAAAAQIESQPEPVAAKPRSRGGTKPKPDAKPVAAGRPNPASRSELGRKPPAKNTPAASRASRGKKKSK